MSFTESTSGKNSAKVGIIPFTYFRNNRKPVGSSFLRVDALINNNPDFEKWQHGKKYDCLLFQKAYWLEMMQLYEGPMILDLCDPDWIKNGVDIVKTGNLVHAITCSSQKLVDLLQNYFNDKIIVHVPDRLDLTYYPGPKGLHSGPAKSLIWFGFIQNAHETLEQLAPTIKKHNLKLTIISHEPYSKVGQILELNPAFHLYDHASAYENIKMGDIVLNPKSRLAFFKYKSNNKSIISWKLGLPVAETNEDIEFLLDPSERNKQVVKMQHLVERNYDINQSAEQYRQIISGIQDKFFK